MIDGKFSSLGQLDLIQTQTASSAFLDFEDLNDYNTYLFTIDNCTVSTQTEIGYRLKYGGSYVTSTYHFANKREQPGGSAERKSISQASVRLGGAVLLYGARNSGTKTFTNSHVNFINSGAGTTEFGSGMLTSIGIVDGIRFGEGIFSALDAAVISQYGLKVY